MMVMQQKCSAKWHKNKVK